MTNGDKENFVGLNLVSVKDVQVGLQRQWHGQKTLEVKTLVKKRFTNKVVKFK